MPRTLPWLQSESKLSPGSSHVDVDVASKKRKRSNNDYHEKFNQYTSSRREASRTPSTSPPPAPPSIEFMREGDDDWIMVEDEFLMTAQAFTRHLHHAEYQRIKKQNQQKTRETLESIKRPTKADAKPDEATSRTIEMKSKRRSLDEKAKKALIQADRLSEDGSEVNSSDDSNDLTIPDRSLAGLMHGSDMGREQQNVSSVPGAQVRSKTRAAAGMSSNATRKPQITSQPGVISTDKHNVAKAMTPEVTPAVRKDSVHAGARGYRSPSLLRSKAPSREQDASTSNRHAHEPSRSQTRSTIFEHSVADNSRPLHFLKHDPGRVEDPKSASTLRSRLKARQLQQSRDGNGRSEAETSKRIQDDEVPMWLV